MTIFTWFEQKTTMSWSTKSILIVTLDILKDYYKNKRVDVKTVCEKKTLIRNEIGLAG